MPKRTFLIIAAITGLLAFSVFSADLSTEQLLPTYLSKDAYTPAAAFGEDQFLIVWQAGRLLPGDLRLGPKYQGDIVACRVSASGTLLDAEPFVIADTTDIKQAPRAAFGDHLFLVVWQDLRNGSDWDVYAARITPEGEVLDPNGVLVSGGIENQALPKVAWDGANFVVVWQDGRSGLKYETYQARISLTGEVLEPAGVLLATGISNCVTPAIAPTNTIGRVFAFSLGGSLTFSGAYQSQIAPTTGTFITNGSPDATPAVITGMPQNLAPLALAKGNNSYLLTWRTDRPFGRGNSKTSENMAIFNANGSHDTTLAYFWPSGTDRILDPDVSWNGSSYVVVWHQRFHPRSEYPYESVIAAMVNEDGQLSGSMMNVSGTSSAPSLDVCVASDTVSGTSIIAYERQATTSDVPITVAYRMCGNSTSISANPAERQDGFVFRSYPNPFNPTVNISIRSAKQDITLEIIDSQGKIVADLTTKLKEGQNGQFYHVKWDASRNASGVYLARLKQEHKETISKLFLMR
jgi:hypothetical protein